MTEMVDSLKSFGFSSSQYYDKLYAGISLALFKDKEGPKLLEILLVNDIQGTEQWEASISDEELNSILYQINQTGVRPVQRRSRYEYVIIMLFLTSMLRYPKSSLKYISDDEIYVFIDWMRRNLGKLQDINVSKYFNSHATYVYSPMINTK